jgi:hypothetical protein
MINQVNNLFVVGFICFLGVVFIGGESDLSAIPSRVEAREHIKSDGSRSDRFHAAIEFSLPKRYVVISYPENNMKWLYTSGDLIFHGKKQTPVLSIERIEQHGVLFRHKRSDKKKFLPFGYPLPDLPHLTLVQKVPLTEIHYQFKMVDDMPEFEPILKFIEGRRAYVEKEVLEDSLHGPQLSTIPVSSTKVVPTLLPSKLITNIKITQVDKETYDIDKESLKPLYKSLRRHIGNPNESLGLAIAAVTHRSLEFHTSVVDGTLSKQGFTLTRVVEGERFGLRIGDRLISINEQPVFSPRSAWWVVQVLLIKNRELTPLRLKIVRDGMLIRTTYRIK